MTGSLFELIADIYRVFAWRLPLLFVLTLLSAAFEGVTLAMLLPLLAALGFGGSAGAPDVVTRAVTALFGALGVPFTTNAVGVLLLILLGVSAAIFLGQAYLATRLQAAYVAHWQKKVFAALTASNWGYLRRQRSGDIVGALTSEPARLGGAFYQANLIVSSIVFLASQAVIAAVIAPVIVAAIVALALGLFAATRHLMRRALAQGGDLTRANADLYASSGELVGAMKLVKATAQERQANRLIDRVVDRIERLSFTYAFDVQIVRASFEYVSGAAVVGLLIAGPLMFGVEIGAVIIIVAMFVRLFPRVTALRQCLQSLGLAMPAYQTLRAMAAEAGDARESSAGGASPAARAAAALSFEQTTIRDDGNGDILRAVELKIPPGAFVGVVGPTGAGKTTLIDCALGLVPLASGDVLIDGESIRSVSLSAWRQSVGYLGQEPVLFAGSIRDNVCWGRDGFGDADVAAALRSADAGFALTPPLGLDALVGDRGGTLSGGERQRLALARAFLGRPRLLVLDEATSALDAETERRIADAVAACRGSMTILAVTHRLSAVRNADFIVVLERGRVVEQGSFSDLIGRQGRFAALWRMQSEDSTAAVADRLATA